MYLQYTILCMTIFSLIQEYDCARILVMFPMASKSHSILGQGVVTHLLEAGHEVVHITSFPREKPVKNLKEINMFHLAEELAKQQPEKVDEFRLKNQLKSGTNFAASIGFLFFAHEVQKKVLESNEITALLGDPKEKFDAVFIEWFFSDYISGVAPLLQCPLIWLCSTEAHWMSLKVIDEIPNTAYNIDLFSEARPPLSFWQRVTELWTVFQRITLMNLLIVPKEKEMYEKIFNKLANKRGVTMPPFEDAVYNGSMMFVNSHPSLGTPFKLPQNVKYIGGYHIDEKTKPLPEDLQKIMDNAKNGVIYFSMGSNLKSQDMTDEMRDSLLNMFGSLKVTVIWKFEADLPKIPPNVHLVKWAPQQSILAHPNLKFFITHGGQLSTTEAVHCAVPVIGLPVMADQHMNMISVSSKGFGITVKITDDVADNLRVAIQEMLSNQSYKLKAKELSVIYHDRTLSPGKEMVHWVEHVVRTRGATHLRSPALLVPWYQKMYLDLIAVLMILLIAACILTKRVCHKLCSKMCQVKKPKTN